jgi:tetratricopeptide (TPR) repeat protein
LRAIGRFAEAAASYRRALALRPDFSAAHSNLGLLLCDQGDLAAAVGHCERAASLDPCMKRGTLSPIYTLGGSLKRLKFTRPIVAKS